MLGFRRGRIDKQSKGKNMENWGGDCKGQVRDVDGCVWVRLRDGRLRSRCAGVRLV